MPDNVIPGGPWFSGNHPAGADDIPPDPTGEAWRGPRGPQGPAGPSTPMLVATAQLTLTADIGNEQQAQMLGAIPTSLVLQVQTQQAPGDQANYTLEFWSASVGSGDLIYQATGVNVSPYNDRACWLLGNVGSVWVRLVNLDPVAATITVSFGYAPFPTA